ncbi:polysaccharide deacetylase family protein [Paenibacillus sp. MSJ-34]|uniref:polysaccharide deacetylase family protein n=1 Tax=Paenibacillus sp. MSJ-34 TaxID=2841529 RepID=UPI001C128D1C|nr:polysaccharide deacetylase family protein [Paenibacillus sp. MSJ-34]MBU5441641.1 polysaccharide deacetylase family protein [Paenibacillus sp. MSJ-34]
MKRIAPYIQLTIAALVIVSCTARAPQAEQPDRSIHSENAAETNESSLANGGTAARGTQIDQAVPLPDPADPANELAGGSETTERVVRPADNAELQRKFPETFFLHGPEKGNRIALTFDDGPDIRFTPQVLDILQKYDTKATFFLLGSRADGLPEITQRIHREGHAIGSHTYWHPKLVKEGVERMKWELAETDKALKRTAGMKPRMFRPPYGALTEELMTELVKMKYKVIGWNVDSLDWKQIDSATIQDIVLSQLRPGSIVLMHSAGNWDQDLSGMVQALDALIPRLQQEGYTFVTVPELLGIPEKR